MAKRKAAKPKGDELPSNKLIAYEQEFDKIEENTVNGIDELAVYDELMSGVLLAVREDIKKGLDAEAILAKYAGLAAARVTTIALTDLDSGKALAASKDILDRALGKARERKELTHKLDKVDDKQLDAILLTELESLEVEYEDVSEDDSE